MTSRTTVTAGIAVGYVLLAVGICGRFAGWW
ncbi:hypothetical protein PTE31013_02449 [Pandoraea terrigena]|uniref:Uncharacterized protein n=1 Tax=Pandoraea terrigena TaxID=2508292 RepID=A0A5E4V6Z8_9BURK|nr:hypothetical protein PTE31013_02449 [Pandoraea terrigena]